MAHYHPEALKYFSNIGAVFLFRFAAEYLYFSSSSAISYLAAFNYTTGKMDAQYHSVNRLSLSFSWKYSSEETVFFKREMLSFFLQILLDFISLW